MKRKHFLRAGFLGGVRDPPGELECLELRNRHLLFEAAVRRKGNHQQNAPDIATSVHASALIPSITNGGRNEKSPQGFRSPHV